MAIFIMGIDTHDIEFIDLWEDKLCHELQECPIIARTPQAPS